MTTRVVIIIDLIITVCCQIRIGFENTLHKKATIHQVTTKPVISKNALFPGQWCSGDNQSLGSSAPVVIISRWL